MPFILLRRSRHRRRSGIATVGNRRRGRLPHESFDGFTLLEVILALAVLAVSLAIIGEANTAADRNARRAASESDATLIAESVMAELVAGTRDLLAADAVPWDDGQETAAWTYSIAVEPTQFDGLLATRVTVQETQPFGQTPVQVSLVRWLVDPALESAVASTDDSL